MTGRLMRNAVLGGVAALALMAAPSAGTEREADPRWLPWLGCWQPAGGAADHLLCIRPLADAQGVEMITYADGRVLSEETVRADGEQRSVQREGCNGWERADFSRDGKRLYLRSEFACEGDVRRSSTGLISMTSPTTWLDVQTVGAGGQNAVRSVRYTLATPERMQAAGVEPIAEDRAMAVTTARTAAAAPLTVDDLIEAAAHVSAEALEAWVVERGDRLALDAGSIERMADAGVPESAIDLAIAVSYPDRFAVDRTALEGEMLEPERAERSADRYVYPGWEDPFHWDPFRYSRYGYRYSPYGYGGGYGWYPGYRPVIVVVDGDADDADPPGRVVRGRGYTRGGRTVSPPGSSGSYRPSDNPGRATTGSAGAVRSDGAKAGSTSRSTGRKAKPRGGTGGL